MGVSDGQNILPSWGGILGGAEREKKNENMGKNMVHHMSTSAVEKRKGSGEELLVWGRLQI